MFIARELHMYKLFWYLLLRQICNLMGWYYVAKFWAGLDKLAEKTQNSKLWRQ